MITQQNIHKIKFSFYDSNGIMSQILYIWL